MHYTCLKIPLSRMAISSHLCLSCQESRRKDLGGGGASLSSKSAPSTSSVKIPAAHSTSPGLGAAPAAVSTTTSTGRRTKYLGERVKSMYHSETSGIIYIIVKTDG